MGIGGGTGMGIGGGTGIGIGPFSSGYSQPYNSSGTLNTQGQLGGNGMGAFPPGGNGMSAPFSMGMSQTPTSSGFGSTVQNAPFSFGSVGSVGGAAGGSMGAVGVGGGLGAFNIDPSSTSAARRKLKPRSTTSARR